MKAADTTPHHHHTQDNPMLISINSALRERIQAAREARAFSSTANLWQLPVTHMPEAYEVAPDITGIGLPVAIEGWIRKLGQAFDLADLIDQAPDALLGASWAAGAYALQGDAHVLVLTDAEGMRERFDQYDFDEDPRELHGKLTTEWDFGEIPDFEEWVATLAQYQADLSSWDAEWEVITEETLLAILIEAMFRDGDQLLADLDMRDERLIEAMQIVLWGAPRYV